MKSRRQSSGGSSAACAAGEANTHTHSGGGGGGGCKLERKDVEKNRRLHMKSLCLKLSSLLPPAATHASLLSDAAAAAASNPNNKDTVTQLDSAAAYIKQLKGRIEALKQRKAGGPGPAAGCNGSGGAVTASSGAGSGGGVRMPVIEVRYQDGTLDVVLISDAGRPFKLHQVITVLEQEGAEVVSASFSVIGDKIFYTIHSQALSPRIGLDAARVSQGLHHLLLLAPPCLI
ncbi:transcription factor bHLH168-like [Miscanthus floridulus]|uniref:transcription factor bHLH168-like n=1 Tax=Miscanthus floridulus TaxID=154761 RepID=UPI0034590BB7